MESLAEHIRKVLNYSKSCTIFRPEVARVWPQVIEMTEQRNAAIQEFARERGWTATIVDPGIIVTFEKNEFAVNMKSKQRSSTLAQGE